MKKSLEKKLPHESSTPKKFDLQYLKHITKNFSKDQILGSGGFGIVYKGQQENGEVLVVKKLLMSTTGMDDKQFMNEVQHTMYICHPNIVRLEGYCYQTEKELIPYNGYHIFIDEVHRFLCFEYLPNGSLDKYLSDESAGLEWHTRYNIIMGICTGLYCLHEGREGAPILHLDLKPSNILLDKNMTPKIADFGLSRLFDGGKTHISTAQVIGSRGYIAPEYIDRFILSKETDIYSLGVIILEILTGLRKYPEGTSNDEFIEVSQKWRTRLQKTSNNTSFEKECQHVDQCIELGLKCMDKNPKRRPNIREIVQILKRIECSVKEDSSDGEEQSRKWRETLDTSVSEEGSPEQAIEALNAIFDELNNWVDDTMPEYIINDADRLASCLTMVQKESFRTFVRCDSSHRIGTVQTIVKFAQFPRLVRPVKKGTLEELVTEMLIRLSIEEVLKIDCGSYLHKPLEVTIVKILEENADRMSLFVILSNLLRPLDSSRWPFSTPLEVLVQRNKRFSELVGKYLHSVNQKGEPDFECTINEDLDIDLILESIHIFTDKLGEEEIDKRKANDDVLVQVVLLIMYGLVKAAGSKIKGHLSMVPVDADPRPIILTLIEEVLERLAAEATSSVPVPPTGQTSHAESSSRNRWYR